MSKITKHGKEAREALLEGVNFLANAVRITEGPRGQNCILGQRALGQTPKVTRDGVTVANYTDPSDPIQQMGADLVREAAQKTDNAVGDGTTATVVLAQAMVQAGFSMVDQGSNPLAIERGIHKAVEVVIARVRKMAKEVDYNKILQVATVSAHGDAEIGGLVAEAIKKAGKEGIVTAEPSSNSNSYIETVAGIELEKASLLSPAFITHPEEMKCELSDCRILLWEGVIGSAKSLLPLLSQVRDKSIPLLIIAGGFEAEAISMLVTNRIKGALPINAVRMEAYGDRRKEVMRDIAALCGGKAHTEDMGTRLENVLIEHLGQARKAVTNMSKTQIIDGRGRQEEVVGRVNQIRAAIENAAPAEKTIYRKRLAALLGGITLIKVGGVTVTEMEEKKDRVVDAMSAAKSAVEAGVVPGGGTALLHSSEKLFSLKVSQEEQAGVDLISYACGAVARQIIDNAGLDGAKFVSQLSAATPHLGYNAFTGVFEDLVASGIIDPANVVIEALKNAAAVACSLITTGAIVAEKQKGDSNV